MDNVLNFLRSLSINKNEYIIVACSGGPDSMFLINLLYNLKYKIVCAHVNHKVRKESDDEFKFVQSYCEDKGIIFEGVELTDIVVGNFERYARNFRYSFFEKIIKKYNSRYLFTAHHGDDLIETILMRIVRGSSLKGYSGFLSITKKNDYNIVRPLIYLTKEEIEESNKEHNIKYVIDDSNYTDNYTRNRYRHHLLPFLKEEDNLVHEKFLLFSKEINDVYSYIDSITKNIVNKIYIDNILNIKLFKEHDEFIQRKILEYILNILYPDNLYLVDSKHVNELIKMIESSKPNISLNLPNNIKVIKEYNNLMFDIDYNLESNYNYELIDNLIINDCVFNIVNNTDDKSNYTIRLNSDDIKLPLRVRTRKDGDKMRVKNMTGRKKVNDIFIDLKINANKRDAWPILIDANNEILWLPGLKKSNFDIPKEEEYDIIITYQKKERDYE